MMDLGIMFVAYILLPVSTLMNFILLFPVPKFIQTRVREISRYYMLKALILSAILFGLYIYSYSMTQFRIHESDPMEIRMEARSVQWKLERNYHITFFNLINWAVCAGTDHILTRIELKEMKKDKKKE